MDPQDAHYAFSRARSREPSTSTTASNWPAQFLSNRSQGASDASRRGSASFLGQSEPQASNSYQTNSSVFQANSETSAIWPSTSRWNTADSGNALRRTGSSPAPGLMNGSSDNLVGSASSNQARFAVGQQAPNYMRNSMTSLGLSQLIRSDFSNNDISASTLSRQMDSLSFNSDPFDAPSGSAASVYSSHTQRANFQSATAFSSPGAGANAVPLHRGSLPDASMPRQGMNNARETYSPYDLGMSAYPQASGSASFQLNPGSMAWNSTSSHTNGATGYVQNRNFSQPVDQHNYGYQGGVSYQQQGHHGYNADGAAGLLDRRSSVQAELANQLPPFVRDSDSQTIALRAALAQGHQVTASSIDALAAANYLSAGRAAVTPQSLQEQYLQSQNMFVPGFQNMSLQFGSPIMHNAAAGSLRDRDPLKNMKSSLLKTFLESKGNRNFELLDIVGHVVEFSGDQHGSRFIQTKLETANKETKDLIFAEMADNIVPLTKDVFGNYVIQKFLEHGSQKQKEYIAEKMKGRMVDLSTQCYSCRVVQRVMQNALHEQKLVLARELDGHVVRVVKDNSGNHVVQKVMEEIDRSELDFVVDALRSKVIELSTHNYGCRIIQKLHDVGTDADRAMIVAEVKDHVQELSMGQYGNYVIQKIIQGDNAEHRSIIISGVIDKLAPMCKQKFASNVVEACIKNGSPEDRRRIRVELDKVDSNEVSVLHHLTNDMFGNYVLQNLLRSLEGEDQRLFAEALTAQVELHRKAGSGRPNAAIDRLAEAIAQVDKAAEAVVGSPKTQSAPSDSTPPLTEAPSSPENSSPPSVKSGPPASTISKTGETLSVSPVMLTSDE